MAEYKIKILPVAQEDMKAIVAHIRMDDPEAAVGMVEKIKAAIGSLTEFPLKAPVPLDKVIAGQGYRMLVVHPYLIFYIVAGNYNTVEIHRVLHGKRDYAGMLC